MIILQLGKNGDYADRFVREVKSFALNIYYVLLMKCSYTNLNTHMFCSVLNLPAASDRIQ